MQYNCRPLTDCLANTTGTKILSELGRRKTTSNGLSGKHNGCPAGSKSVEKTRIQWRAKSNSVSGMGQYR